VVVDRAAVLGDDVAAREVAVWPVGAVADEPLLHAASTSARSATNAWLVVRRAPERVLTTGAWCVMQGPSAKKRLGVGPSARCGTRFLRRYRAARARAGQRWWTPCSG
jgi:hypothetical protein